MTKTTLLAVSSDNSGLNPMSFTDPYSAVGKYSLFFLYFPCLGL